MIENLNREIAACKRRIGVLRPFIYERKTAGHPSIEAEQQLELETELLRMLEAQLVTEEAQPH